VAQIGHSTLRLRPPILPIQCAGRFAQSKNICPANQS